MARLNSRSRKRKLLEQETGLDMHAGYKRRADKQEKEKEKEKEKEQEQRKTSQLLPDDVLAWNVFIHLPLRQFTRLRTLSKSLKTMLECKPLLHTWQASSEEWLLIAKNLFPHSPTTQGLLISLNIMDKDYHEDDQNIIFPMPLHQSLTCNLMPSLFSSLSRIEEGAHIQRVSSARGLICALILGDTKMEDDYQLVVFNPLTGEKRDIPKPVDLDYASREELVLAMISQSGANGCSHSYYIVLRGWKNLMHIYDSITRQWKFISANVIDCTGDFRQADVIFDSVMYKVQRRREKESALIGYNVEKEEWSYACVPNHGHQDVVNYIKHRGRLYMVASESLARVRTRAQTARLSQLFLLEPGNGIENEWVKVGSLDDGDSFYEGVSLVEHRDPSDCDVEGQTNAKVRSFRPQFTTTSWDQHAHDLSMSCNWHGLLLSLPLSTVPLTVFRPSFSAHC